MKKYIHIISSIAFFAFICWIIILADQDRDPFLIQLAHRIPMGDKLGHFILYGILALLLNLVFHFRKIRFFGKPIFTGSFLTLAFAIIEEFTQLAFPSRTFDFLDMTFDILGVYLVSISFLRLKKLMTSNQ